MTKKEKGKIDKFFEGPWNSMIFKLRFVIIVLFLIWAVVAAVYAS